MKTSPPLTNPHRFARVISWAKAMLAWVALVLSAPAACMDRRHISQRHGFLRLDRLQRLVYALIIIRAAEMLKPRGRRAPLRDAAPAGFRRRIRRTPSLRVIVGGRLHKALRGRNAVERITRLLAALADIDGFARRYVGPRARRRLTRFCPIIISAPPAQDVISLAALTPCAADSS